MGRLARYQLAGYTYHVVQRGHNRSKCFVNARDFELYLGLLTEFRSLFPSSIHAYALMPNHVHLLVTPAALPNLSLLMKNVTQRYVQHFNRTYLRSGSLWEGRFRSYPIDSEAYLLKCQRYIELNPVRAGIARHPAEYAWSSYRCNAGMEPSPLIDHHELFVAVASTDDERVTWYRNFVSTPPGDREVTAIRNGFSQRNPLGAEAADRLPEL